MVVIMVVAVLFDMLYSSSKVSSVARFFGGGWRSSRVFPLCSSIFFFLASYTYHRQGEHR